MKISQREARRLQKRVSELEKHIEEQRHGWGKDWPGGTHFRTFDATAHGELRAAIKTARTLKHAVVVALSDTQILFYALPLASAVNGTPKQP